MNSRSLRLYVDSWYASPYAMSAFVALHEKMLPFEMVTVDLAAAEHCAGAYAVVSRTRRIPSLVDGEFSLSDSSAIAEYLDEKYPGVNIYPRSLEARAMARQVQAWLRSDLAELRVERPTEVIFFGKIYAPLSFEARVAAEKLISFAQQMLPPSATNLFGDWSIADTDLALMLNRLAMHGDSVPEHLARYAQVQFERPSVRRWLGQVRPQLVS